MQLLILKNEDYQYGLIFVLDFEHESDKPFFKIYPQCLLIFKAESLKFNNTL
jgi:hypothetical protein